MSSVSTEILRNKSVVLYILDNDPNSSKAINIARNMSDVHIQNVRMLSADQIPNWLNSVPTCVVLNDKKRIFRGGDVLQYLSQRLVSLQQQMARHQQQLQQHPSHTQMPPLGSNFPQRQMPPGFQNGSATLQGANSSQQRSQGMNFPPPGMPQYPPSQQFPGNVQPLPSEHISSSIQPASGTGQFGCSLDTAFQTSEEPSGPPEVAMGSSGSITQHEMQEYLKRRESSGPARLRQNQAVL